MAGSDDSFFGYAPNYPANIIGCVLFGLIAITQFILGIYTQDWWMWVTWTLAAGGECAGYVARTILHDQFSSAPMWEMQLVLTIIMPAFMSAGLYYQLAVQIVIYGEQYSPLKPMHYNAIFTTCDVISLVIQAVGGGVAASNLGPGKSPDDGGWVMVGGIAFQVLILVLFILMGSWVNYKIFSDNPDNWNPEYKKLREKKLFKLWIPTIAISLLFLLIRSIYRIVELSVGWTGYLMTTERYFLVLDGLMIVLGMVPLCLVYPGLIYGYVPIPGLHKSATKSQKAKDIEAGEYPEFKDAYENF